MLWIIKLTVTPLLVGLMSLAARAWGPTIGGLIMGLPWMTGPILFFFAIDKGEAYAARVAIGVELGAASIGAWAVTYALMARRFSWPWCVAAALIVFAAFAVLWREIEIGLVPAAALAAAGLIGGYLAVPRPTAADGPRSLPWWDIPMRMLATAGLVAIIIATSDRLGEQLSGVVSTYPVIATVVGAFTHHRWGVAAVVRLFRAVLLSLIGFVAFFLVVGLLLPKIGILPAFAAAAATAVTSSLLLIGLARTGWIKS